MEEISYLKRYQSFFNKEISEFVNCDLIELEIENEFNQKFLRLKFNKNCDSRDNSLKFKWEEQLDPVLSMMLRKQKTKVKTVMNPYENRIVNAEKKS